jgi:hypothetical protein
VTEPQRAPSIGPTKPLTLVIIFAIAAVLAYVLERRFFGDVAVPTLPLATFVVLALIEGLTARITRARIERKPGTEPIPPLTAARLMVLAKASSIAGALFSGLYAGALLFLLSQAGTLSVAGAEAPIAGGGVVTAGLLVAAALWLERSCRIPPTDDDDDKPTAEPTEPHGPGF